LWFAPLAIQFGAAREYVGFAIQRFVTWDPAARIIVVPRSLRETLFYALRILHHGSALPYKCCRKCRFDDAPQHVRDRLATM
jgi:hypothetical protein